MTYFLGDEAYVRALPGLGWWPTHDEAEWLGNLVGDVAWTIEPTFVQSSMYEQSTSSTYRGESHAFSPSPRASVRLLKEAFGSPLATRASPKLSMVGARQVIARRGGRR